MVKKAKSVHVTTAIHEARGPHGEFISTHSPPILPNSPSSPSLPSNFLIQLWKNLGKLSLKKLTAIAAFISLIATNGIFQNIIEHFFPYSSPLLHRQVAHQGTLKTSGNGSYSLTLPDSSVYTLYLKPSPTLNSLKNLNEVVVKGNLTLTPYTIENAEIYPLNISTPNTPPPPTSSNLPKLYSGLTWEVTQSKTLLFTSGKRRIEQEGVYLESAQVNSLPQDFINYYTQALQSLGFKQTLNSSEPTGATITYAKDELFFTFGVKNIFQGSGDNKNLIGYKAFIEHN